MIVGIGVDTVAITEMKEILAGMTDGGRSRLFAAGELAVSETLSDPATYLATRFAAKEAVFKAVAHHMQEQSFDLRMVETLNHEDGSPYIFISEALKEVLDDAGISDLHISITTEKDFVTAFVVAERREKE